MSILVKMDAQNAQNPTAKNIARRALIFAAGRGERMLPLTLHTPKPLLEVDGKALIVWQIERLVRAGITEIVVNLSYLADKLRHYLGNGSAFGATILYSAEGEEPLETGGGIRAALELLSPDGYTPFLVCNGDVYSEFDYATLALDSGAMARLVLVPNPVHHPNGDFAMSDARCRSCGPEKFTFSGIGLYHPKLFVALPFGRYRLAPILSEAMSFGQVQCQLFDGLWTDVGTPERLNVLDAQLRAAHRPV